MNSLYEKNYLLDSALSLISTIQQINANMSGGKLTKSLKKPAFSRYFIALIFIVAGILHFIKTEAYVSVMPEYIPYHKAMVLISGAAEALGGIGILIPKVRKWAAWGLIVLLIVVFPVNIEMAAEAYKLQGWSLKFIGYLLRLPLQFVLIYWIYWACVKIKVNTVNDT